MRHSVAVAVALAALLIGSASFAEESPPNFKDVKNILSRRCQTCHSEFPSQMEYSETGAPNGVKFDTADQIKMFAPKIWVKAIEEKIMPPGNITNITDGERETIANWIKAGSNPN